jgi:hypothetical protein
MAAGTARAYIDGTVVIEATPQPIRIPISAQIPPQVPGVFVFDTGQLDVDNSIKINIGSFLTWLGTAFGINIPVNDLPPSIQTLTIAVFRIFFNTASPFEFDVQIMIGSMVDDKWEPVWKPIPSIGLTLEEFGLQATNEEEVLAWIPTLAGLAAAPPAAPPRLAAPAPPAAAARPVAARAVAVRSR